MYRQFFAVFNESINWALAKDVMAMKKTGSILFINADGNAV
jgi:hypothetical protein